MRNLLSGLLFLTLSLQATAQRPEIVIRSGHPDRMFEPVFSKDGRYILTCSDGSAKLWESSTGSLIRTFLPTDGRFGQGWISDDNAAVALDEFDNNRINTFNTRTGALLFSSYESEYDRTDSNVINISQYGDGELRILPRNYGGASIAELKGYFYHAFLDSTRKFLYALKKKGDSLVVECYSFPRAKLLRRSHAITVDKEDLSFDVYRREKVAVCSKGQVWVFSLSDLAVVKKLRAPEKNTYRIDFSKTSSQWLACFGGDSSISILNMTTQKVAAHYKDSSSRVIKVVFSPNNDIVFVGAGTSQLLDLGSGRPIEDLYIQDSVWYGDYGYPGRIVSAFFSNDQSELLVYYNTGLLKVFDGHDRHLLRQQLLPKGYRGDIVYDPGTNLIVEYESEGEHRFLEVIDFATLKPVWAFAGNSNEMRIDHFDRDGQRIIITRDDDSRIFTFDLKTSNLTSHGASWEHGGDDPNIENLIVNPSKGQLISIHYDRTIKVWDSKTLDSLTAFKGAEGDIIAEAVVSPNGKYLVTGTRDAVIRIWDTESWKILKEYSARSAGSSHWSMGMCFSPDSRYFASKYTGPDDPNLLIFDLETEDRIWPSYAHEQINEMAFDKDDLLLVKGSYSLSILDPGKRQVPYILTDGHEPVITGGKETHTDLQQAWRYISGVGFTKNPGEIYIWYQDSTLETRDFRTFSVKAKRRLESGDVSFDTTTGELQAGRNRHDFDSLIITGSGEDRIDISRQNNVLATLIITGPDSWLVVDSSGLFDASPEAMADMYFVAPTKAGPVIAETIALDQLKPRYYQPSLIPILFGFKNESLRKVPVFEQVELPPAVGLKVEMDTLRIELTDRGGGIGKVSVSIGNNEIIEDARRESAADAGETLPSGTGDSSLALMVDLSSYKRLVDPDTINRIKVTAYNKKGWLSSRPVFADYSMVGARGAVVVTASGHHQPPRFFAVVMGVSDYAGTGFDLRFAAKDAQDFAAATRIPAANLFGGDETIVRTLSDSAVDSLKPTKSNFLRVMHWIAGQAAPQDVLVVYLSGHGINYGGQDGDFYYLTRDASAAAAMNLQDPGIRKTIALSSDELTKALNEIAARKKVLVLDACASGKAAEQLTGTKDIPASQQRALDRMADRTGFYVLAGSTAEGVSYESSLYDQGLLTYSLLKAMRGAALRNDGNEEYVDVQRLLQYSVDEVPKLSRWLGGIQQPFYRSPADQRSYDIGKEDQRSKTAIVLAEPKPVFMATSLFDLAENEDDLHVGSKIDAELMETASKGKKAELVFTDAKDYPGAWRLTGNYKVEGKKITLNYRLRSGDKKVDGAVTGEFEKMDEFVERVLEDVKQAVNK